MRKTSEKRPRTAALVSGAAPATQTATRSKRVKRAAKPMSAAAAHAAGGNAVSDAVARIAGIASAASITRYQWIGRGLAPAGYIKGMAVYFGHLYARLLDAEPVAVAIAKKSAAHDSMDALVWYSEQFAAASMDNSGSDGDRLRHLFVLMTGLGMRESSGRYCEGRDHSAHNITAETCEAGLFQVSYNLSRHDHMLVDIFAHYKRNNAGFLDIYKEGVRARAIDLENYGSENEPGFEFQRLTKLSPAFAVEFAALGLRKDHTHWGPIHRHEAEIRAACDAMLKSVQDAVDGSAAVRASLLRALDQRPAAAPPLGAAPLAAAAPAHHAVAVAHDNAAYFMESVPLHDLLPINKGLSSATQHTMVSTLGSPQLPLTTSCQNERASELVKRNMVTVRITPNFRLAGLKPAIEDVQGVLEKAFADAPDLKSVLSTEGMLCVRYRKPTSGAHSTAISNHSWGTAVDFKIAGYEAPGNSGQHVPRFIALLLPYFNRAGWYSGIAFHDSMHFEVSEERIRKWVQDGALG